MLNNVFKRCSVQKQVRPRFQNLALPSAVLGEGGVDVMLVIVGMSARHESQSPSSRRIVVHKYTSCDGGSQRDKHVQEEQVDSWETAGCVESEGLRNHGHGRQVVVSAPGQLHLLVVDALEDRHHDVHGEVEHDPGHNDNQDGFLTHIREKFPIQTARGEVLEGCGRCRDSKGSNHAHQAEDVEDPTAAPMEDHGKCPDFPLHGPESSEEEGKGGDADRQPPCDSMDL